MADIDEFAQMVFEEAKRFLEKAAMEGANAAQSAYLHAALLLGFSALEAHVNAVCEELAALPDLSPHEVVYCLRKRCV